jgi:hypothetical protein
MVSHGGSPVIPLPYFRKRNLRTSGLVFLLANEEVPLFLYHNPLLVIQALKSSLTKNKNKKIESMTIDVKGGF